eukprot:TRINITY_DN9175_c0_g1_i2.p1 TRINITY_DN9175_c0_g1~~TRINITY_DN9175_c0_g1_i2.p1  ORF type:complete len:139 (+),score=34.84 TRINITY_DN9175_c0_g1_i2:113-529(+)
MFETERGNWRVQSQGNIRQIQWDTPAQKHINPSANKFPTPQLSPSVISPGSESNLSNSSSSKEEVKFSAEETLSSSSGFPPQDDDNLQPRKIDFDLRPVGDGMEQDLLSHGGGGGASGSENVSQSGDVEYEDDDVEMY